MSRRRRNTSEPLSETHRRYEADPDEPIEPMLIARARVGDEAAASALRIISRLNKKELSLDRVAAAAECGHPGARLLRPDVVMTSGDGLPGLDLLDWRKQQLFAADCVEIVLPIYETIFPQDMRVRDAITARRNLALGKRGAKKRWDVVSDASRDAAHEATVANEDASNAPEWDVAWAAAIDSAIDVANNAAMAASLSAAMAAEESSWRVKSGSAMALARADQRLRLADYLVGDAP